ncbi:MAG: YraN family protein [FCB group bacterium]|jgi:putative endonuclease
MESNNSKQNTRQKGKESETLAIKYLEEKGFIIIKQNFTFGRIGEIDIVAEDGATLVFVEVKSTKTTLYGNPLEYITPKKQANLRRVAEGYLYVNKINDKPCRFDVITIDYTKKEPEILHLIQAM